MKDAKGKTIEPGQTLKRIVEAPATKIGQTFNVLQYNWTDGGEGEDLVADGGYIKLLLWPERAKEFEIVDVT